MFPVAGGQFPFFVSVAGHSGDQTIDIRATDPSDRASARATVTVTLSSTLLRRIIFDVSVCTIHFVCV